MSHKSLKVSELNNFIKDVVNAGFPQPLWICGEIQGLNRNKGRNHIFFELVEKDEDSKNIIARIGLVIFAGKKQFINDILKRSENAFELKDDIEVKFACRIDFYAPHGAVRLIVENIDPTYTLGKLAQEKQKLITLLKDKGILDKNKQLAMPSVPLNIGLITADDSAAYNDFISELKKSCYNFKVFFRPSLMQGNNAEANICKALDSLQGLPNLDLIVITRGGGSISDLSCFDSQMIAEKIAKSKLPILSGIGHEINLSITDLSAHTYAKTPTAIAQFLNERVEEFLDSLHEKLSFIIDFAEDKTNEEKQKVKNIAYDLKNTTDHFFKLHREKIISFIQLLKQVPTSKIKQNQLSLNFKKESLIKVVEQYLHNQNIKIQGYRKSVDILSPQNTMKRGFSILRNKDGKTVKSISDVKNKEILVTEMIDGIIESEVSSINKGG